MKKHTPVLTRETIKFLAPQSNQNFIDATLGFGGHAEKILGKTTPGGKLLGIDQDPIAISEAKKNLKNYKDRVTYVNENFSKLGLIIRGWKVDKVDGILFDLGVSSYQLTSKELGFSFQGEAELDMRMSPKTNLKAYDIVNKWNEKDIRKILWQYGEEKNAPQIAREIVSARVIKPIETTKELVSIIEKALRANIYKQTRIHFATKTFQALRIAVNDELNVLQSALKQAFQILSPGGRIVVISFHSLEDRIVKKFFQENAESTGLEILTAKPVVASDGEIENNPRARSAKLRAAQKK